MGCLVKARPAFANIPLSYVALPGADNSGTFNLDPQAFDTQVGSACTTLSSAPQLGGPTVQRFSATQDQTITRQLNDGVRWIDLKVGYNGDGNPTGGWRVVQNLYSSWPLSEYLDEVANWAAQHPTEGVVVDIATICYDHDPTPTIDKGLWRNFDTKSVEGAGPKTIANVAARPSSTDGSLASMTVGGLARSGHNVAVVIPPSARDEQVLAGTFHVQPFRATAAGTAASGSTVVEHSDPKVAPSTSRQYSAANFLLFTTPIGSDPRLGSLRGKGFFVSKLAYDLRGTSLSTQNTILHSFAGLIASEGSSRAWMSGLWNGTYGQIMSHWGSKTNVVLADGVDLGGFVPPVIDRNGR
jgi:hypothetical protein